MPYKDKAKQREFNRKWRSERRSVYFQSKQCIKCGSTNNLEIDHIDPSTKVSHKIWSWSEERRIAELKKCQILCSNCHLEKSRIDWKTINRTGILNGSSKLSEVYVKEILSLEGKMSARKVASLYSLHHKTVQKIWARDMWKHIAALS